MYDVLCAHPGVFLPFRKELSFFSAKFEKGEVWYRSFFSEATDSQICGDFSPDYFLHPAAIGRIQALAPDARIILAVREPASWAVSFHRHIATFELRVPRFAEFLERHPVPDMRIFRGASSQQTFSIRDSLVQRTLEEYRRAFGARLLVYSFDYFKARPLAVVQSIERFLGLPPKLNQSALPDGVINSNQRTNIRFLSYLLSRDIVAAVTGRIFPRRFIQGLRKTFDRVSSRPARRATDPSHDIDFKTAQSILAADRDYVASLFAQYPIQLGTGEAFLWDDPHTEKGRCSS
jgi:hypothetical protein